MNKYSPFTSSFNRAIEALDNNSVDAESQRAIQICSAADELLEALEAARFAIGTLRRKVSPKKLTRVTDDIDAQCKAAIAKAKGE
jgi:hypothetical protein